MEGGSKPEKEHRDIVVPGEMLGTDKRSGYGTYKSGNRIISSVLGVKKVVKDYINVVPLSGNYKPKPNDLVVGIVVDVGPTGWFIDIRRPYPALLTMQNAPWDVSFGETSKYMNVGDSVLLLIKSVDEVNNVHLNMQDRRTRKFTQGQILDISPSKVPRVIGKNASMISLLKKYTQCYVFVGQNGRIWIDGEAEKMLLTSQAIELIEREAHHYGLTEKVNEFLKNRTGDGK